MLLEGPSADSAGPVMLAANLWLLLARWGSNLPGQSVWEVAVASAAQPPYYCYF